MSARRHWAILATRYPEVVFLLDRGDFQRECLQLTVIELLKTYISWHTFHQSVLPTFAHEFTEALEILGLRPLVKLSEDVQLMTRSL